MDAIQELARHKGIIGNNIVSRISLPDMTEGLPVFQEAEFEKAIAEGQIEAFTVENVSQFKRNLEKAIADAKGDVVLLSEIEKAGKDLSKLVKVKKQDKRGKMTTVYVRQGEKAKEGGDGEKEKTITHHEGGSTKIVSNGLHVGAVSTHTGEVLKKYRADKPEEVANYARHLAIEHNIPVEDKSDDKGDEGKKPKKEVDGGEKEAPDKLNSVYFDFKDMEGGADKFNDEFKKIGGFVHDNGDYFILTTKNEIKDEDYEGEEHPMERKDAAPIVFDEGPEEMIKCYKYAFKLLGFKVVEDKKVSGTDEFGFHIVKAKKAKTNKEK